MQSSQQQSSSVYVNRYGGFGSSGQTLNQPLYDACMNSKGWTLQSASASSDQVAQNAEVQAAVKAVSEKQAAMCADAKYALYYGKTACRAEQINFEQLADTSKISPGAKAVFSEVRTAVDAANRELMDLLRKHEGALGASVTNSSRGNPNAAC